MKSQYRVIRQYFRQRIWQTEDSKERQSLKPKEARVAGTKNVKEAMVGIDSENVSRDQNLNFILV